MLQSEGGEVPVSVQVGGQDLQQLHHLQVQLGAQPESEDKIDKQLVAALRTVRLLVTTVQVLTRIVRVVRWSKASVETAALQTNRAELGRATATTTTTVEKD